jgi:hypothetical protein
MPSAPRQTVEALSHIGFNVFGFRHRAYLRSKCILSRMSLAKSEVDGSKLALWSESPSYRSAAESAAAKL